jgi:hypothetical protein
MVSFIDHLWHSLGVAVLRRRRVPIPESERARQHMNDGSTVAAMTMNGRKSGNGKPERIPIDWN